MTKAEFEKWLDEAKAFWSENGESFSEQIIFYLDELNSFVYSLISSIPQTKLKKVIIAIKAYLNFKSIQVENYSDLVEDISISPEDIVPTYYNFTLPDYKTLFDITNELDTTDYDNLKLELQNIYSSIPVEIDNFSEKLSEATIDLQLVLVLNQPKTTIQPCPETDSILLSIISYFQTEFNLELP